MSEQLSHRWGEVALRQLSLVLLLHAKLRRGSRRLDHCTYAHGATTMVAFGLLLNIAGLARSIG